METKKKGSKIFIVKNRQEDKKIQINFKNGKKLLVVWLVRMECGICWEVEAIVRKKKRRVWKRDGGREEEIKIRKLM